jgi:ectoine hydroxylase-related dioxygenase (phytanoyl-CoA dioxygenase family)
MILTEQQRAFFDLFGFLYLPGLFADDIAEISSNFDSLFEQYEKDVVEWVHEYHENRMRRFISRVTDKNDYLASLLEDSRIRAIASSLLGSDYECTGSDASIYDCGTLFHQDGHGVAKPQRINIKMALYLDPVDESTGAIRLIPGSHHTGDKFSRLLNTDLFIGRDKLGLRTEEVPATVLASTPGDLMLWNYRILHATAYGGNQRRMLALEFCEN